MATENISRIVVVTQGIPHPAKGASLVLYFHYIRALVEAGYDVHSVVLDADADQETESAYLSRFEATSRFHYHRLKYARPLIPTRFSVAYDQSASDMLRTLVGGIAPDLLLAFDLPALMASLRAEAPRRIVWLGDLQFQTSWYNFTYGFREDWRTLRWIPYAIAQTFQWRRLYRRALSFCDRVIVSSNSSVVALRDIEIESEFLPYPWPNDKVLDRDCRRCLNAKPTFLFFGNLVGLGSRSSLHYLLEDIYPRLLKKWGSGGFEIHVGGVSELRGWASKAIDARTEINFHGFIPDLLQTMARCHAVIAPLDVPVGNRSRILTAMAKRVLVIAHANASLGNPGLVDGETALLARTPGEFISRMQTAFDSPSTCTTIIDQAESYYLENYAPGPATGRLLSLIEEELALASATN